MTSRRLAMWSAGVALMSLAACGGDTAESGAGDAEDQSATETSHSASAAEASAAQPVAPATLPTALLDREALLGRVEDVVVETAPCPFLTDSTAIATADTNRELLRREVSNEACRWSVNAGFSIRVSVESVATATPMKDRAYNLDTPPVLKEQATPGENAVFLYDTAWDNERPYALGFEQNGKLVEIFVTGMDTDPARLTATAEEVAATLPTAPSIEQQYREIRPALDLCTVWSDESVGSLIVATADEGVHSAPYGQSGCKWDTGFGADAKSITFARYSKGDTDLDRMMELGGRKVSGLGDRAVILTRPPTDGYAGDTAIWVELEDQQFNLVLSGTIPDHALAAEILMSNVLSRI